MKRSRFKALPTLATLILILISVNHLVAGEIITPTPNSNRPDEQKAIRWSVLAPEDGKPFNDPFTKLTQDQLSDLSYVVRVQRLISEEKIVEDGVDAKEMAKLAAKLKEDGVDIEWLMVQRQRVRQIRGQQVESVSKSIAKSLGGKKVTLTGYVIPIKTSQKRLTEFFLVPTSAACSNDAAPSPLKAVFVSTELGMEFPKQGIPVRVMGRVEAQTTSKTIRQGIGIKTIQSAYTILSPKFQVYAPTVESGSHP